MSFYDVYIGRLDDESFSWDGGNPSGNVPKRLSPFFPGSGLNHGAFSSLLDRLDDGRFAGKQTDWAGWVVPASKAMIEEFINELYAREPGDRTSIDADPGDRLNELRDYVAGLEDDGQWALVATET